MSQEPPVDDAALVDQVQAARRAARDDFRAFEVLVERYQDRVLGNCRYLTGSQSDAEDLAQEVFAKVFSGLAGFERRSGFKTWLWRIKVNHCLNFLQRSRRERFVAVHEPEVEQRPELQVGPAAPPESGDRVRPRVIAQSLDAMSETLRVPLLLRDLNGFSYQEIADGLGLSLSAVKMRIKRGREDFRKRYGEAQSGTGPVAAR